MRIGFDDEQHDLARSLDRALGSVADPGTLRGLWESDTGRSPRIWEAVASTGLPAVLVPEEHDGAGGTLVDLAPALGRLGHHAVSDALVEACVVGPLALGGLPEEQRGRWLPGVADGSVRVTAALHGLGSVPDAHVADLLVMRRDDHLAVVELDRCERRALVSMDPSRRQFDVHVPDGAAVRLDGGGDLLETVLQHELVASAEVLLGLGRRLIEDTVAYVGVRRQFGRTIGSFQAVKHQIADATALITIAQFQVHAAAAKVAAGASDAATAARAARVVAVDAEREANRVALQLHGGIGFTWEHDLQLWLKRGKALEQAHGGYGPVADDLGERLLAATTRS